jgi:nucleoside-diphosphate-sugar epimerase
LKLFVSGATGYIGGAIARHAAAAHTVYGGIRHTVFGGIRRRQDLEPGIKPIITGDLAETRFGLPEVDVVIHAAGLGHKRGVNRAGWQRQNVDAAVNLARAARLVEAKRFILISTAYVHGRVHEGIVSDDTAPAPMDEYAQSKLDAEQAVIEAFGPGVSIIRPTAVVGPGCPGNIQLLINLLRRGVPLPFASLANQRGFIPVADLATLALAVAQAETPPPVVLAAHPETISTPDLIRALADGLGIPARLFPCPAALLGLGASLLGRGAMWQSLSGNFATAPRAALGLGWKPAESLAESLAATSRYHNTTDKTP